MQQQGKRMPQSTDATEVPVDVINNGNQDRAERLVQVADIPNVKCKDTGRTLKTTLAAMKT